MAEPLMGMPSAYEVAIYLGGRDDPALLARALRRAIVSVSADQQERQVDRCQGELCQAVSVERL